MRRESTHTGQEAELQNTAGAEHAFAYLKSLPRNLDRSALESYKRGRESAIIDYEVAETFTSDFRGTASPFFIPMSWTMTKAALVNLLGITDHTGFEEVNGIRFYAGLNADNQLTLIAVSTKAGSGCNDDLTLEDEYPYYDFADPCPDNCSGSGNLRILGREPAPMKVAVI